jgi:hypothetical protein
MAPVMMNDQRHDATPMSHATNGADGCKTKQIRATLCLHRVSLRPETNRWYNTIF